MKQRDKFYKFLDLFGDCQEKAVFAIRDLTNCKFRTAKIRTIVTNIKFDGTSENFSEIEPFIDMITDMIQDGYDISKFLEDKKYKDLNDDEIFKVEELDEVGLEKYKEELSLLQIPNKSLEYLYFREASFKEKANKEITRLKLRNETLVKKLNNRDSEIVRIKRKPKKKTIVEKFKQMKLF